MPRHSTESKLSNNTSALHNLEKDDDFAMYRENYLFMKQSPMYVRLEQKYKELKKRCREQQTMIDMLNRQQYELMERVVRAQAGVLNVPNVFVSEPVLPVIPPTIKTEKVEESAPGIEYSGLRKETGANDNDTQNIVFVESQKLVPEIVAIEDVVYDEVVEDEEVVDEEQVKETEEVDEEVVEEEEEVDEEETEEVEVVEESEEVEVVEVEEEEEVEVVEVEEEEEVEVVEVEEEAEVEVVEVEEEEEVEVVEEEEGEEVEVVEVEEEEEVEVVEEETEEVEVVEEEEEEGVYEKEINGTRYYITNDTDGTIYEMLDDEEIGQIVGSFVNGKPVFK